ncbi:potassium channel protein [Bacillus aquiflavi]|uniref:Potassium channel family protein n=1 Tax=Bacillus aquiflavi TaxID=2672567 RepID=A0A6B3VY20_9BACI|nr:potassium channel family protein [Bacillus aquiflavi]MBA4536052.1 potassium channel protein [Bacillus aquiflavi]NEY80426.1 potassium channel family protein [Bacillus aquiflavi]
MPQHLYAIFMRLPLIFRIFILALIVIICFGVMMYFMEPETFPTVFDGIWWALITTSTVGYGDLVPASTKGRVAAIVLIFLGIGLVSSYFATIATAAVSRQNSFMKGKVAYNGGHHMIIIGWNERSREIIKSMLLEKNPKKIILIDETLQENPICHNNVHFINGRAFQDEVLMKANIAFAEKVLITADQNKNELYADMNTVLTLLTIKGLNPSICCIAEILTPEQVANAKRAGADEIIQSNALTSFVMVNRLLSTKKTSFFEIINQLQKCKLSFLTVKEEMIGQSFNLINSHLLLKNILLVGIKRGEKTIINPSHPFIIQKDDQLIVVFNENC